MIINSFSFIFQDITDNQAVSDPAFYSLIILYALVIIGSVVGNVLVITAVLKSEKMRKVSESNVTAVTQCEFSQTSAKIFQHSHPGHFSAVQKWGAKSQNVKKVGRQERKTHGKYK